MVVIVLTLLWAVRVVGVVGSGDIVAAMVLVLMVLMLLVVPLPPPQLLLVKDYALEGSSCNCYYSRSSSLLWLSSIVQIEDLGETTCYAMMIHGDGRASLLRRCPVSVLIASASASDEAGRQART